MRAFDLFAGCGGLSLGFLNAGVVIDAACDNWEPAIRVYRANFPNHQIYQLDLSTTTGNEDIFTNHTFDMIIGGPPCQDFSTAGKRDESQGRADLTRSFAHIITTILPQWFVMENVVRAQSSRAFAYARNAFTEANYGLSEVVLDASLYGVPQQRKRLFLIGELGGPNEAVTPFLYRRQSTSRMTIRDYFGNNLGIENYYRHPRTYARRGIFSIDEPSPTIRGVNRPVPPRYQNHPGDSTTPSPDLRPLTTRERSMIQTFPENFILNGSRSDLEQMIGNAVPVRLAQHVALSIQDYIEQSLTQQESPPRLLQAHFT